MMFNEKLERKFQELIIEYRKKFGTSATTFGMPLETAIETLEKAIKTGKPMLEPEDDILI